MATWAPEEKARVDITAQAAGPVVRRGVVYWIVVAVMTRVVWRRFVRRIQRRVVGPR